MSGRNSEIIPVRTSSWGKKSPSLHTVGRKFGDGGMYIVDLENMCPAGILIQAYRQDTSDRYTLSVSEGELARAGLSRSVDDLARLAESVDVYNVNDQMFIHSTIDGIAKPKIIPTGANARAFIQGIQVGDGSLEELLTTALSELCKVKPEGLDAVRWLGEWLLSHNPKKPFVGQADDQCTEELKEDGGSQIQQ